MSLLDALVIVLAGVGAGTINALVGSGTLITFPTLLLLGFAPLTANVSNNIGLVAGGAGAVYGYRTELSDQPLLPRLLPLSLAGSIVGAALLLVLPAAAFRSIVPVLIVLALVLVLVGPRIQAAAARSRSEAGMPDGNAAGLAAGMPGGNISAGPEGDGPTMPGGDGTAVPAGDDTTVPGGGHAVAVGAGVFVGGMYGGYFGAAQGVLLMGLLSALSTEPLQRLNGLKNVLVTAVNLIAAVAFLLFAREHISWPVVALIALGSLLGGLLGARVGRRLSPKTLRAVIVVVGVVAIVKMVWFP